MGDDLIYISEETWDYMHGAPAEYVEERRTRELAAREEAPPATPDPPVKQERLLRLVAHVGPKLPPDPSAQS